MKFNPNWAFSSQCLKVHGTWSAESNDTITTIRKRHRPNTGLWWSPVPLPPPPTLLLGLLGSRLCGFIVLSILLSRFITYYKPLAGYSCRFCKPLITGEKTSLFPVKNTTSSWKIPLKLINFLFTLHSAWFREEWGWALLCLLGYWWVHFRELYSGRGKLSMWRSFGMED